MNNIFIKDSDELIDIRRDKVFKAVFSHETYSSKQALSSLISAFIYKKVEIDNIKSNEPPAAGLTQRHIRFDLSCSAKSGQLINIEMSTKPLSFEPVRLEYYAGKLFTGQDIQGKDKNYDDLEEAWQIAFLSRTRFFPDDNFLHCFEFYDLKNRVPLNGKTRIITVELAKLKEVAKTPVKAMSAAERWAVFFRYLTDKRKHAIIKEIIESEEGIKMAYEALLNISQDEYERARLLSEEKYELDTRTMLSAEVRKAEKRGKREGRLKGRQEIIDMLKSGKSHEEIIREYES